MSIASSLSHHCVIVLSLRRAIAQPSCIVSLRHHIIVIVLSHQHYRRVLFEVDEADIIYCDIIGKKPIKNVLIIKQTRIAHQLITKSYKMYMYVLVI